MNCWRLYVKSTSSEAYCVRCQLMILKGFSSKRLRCISTHACQVQVTCMSRVIMWYIVIYIYICIIIMHICDMLYVIRIYVSLNQGGLFVNCSLPKSPYIQALHWKLFRLSGPFDHRSLEDIPRFSTFQVQIARLTHCIPFVLDSNDTWWYMMIYDLQVVSPLLNTLDARGQQQRPCRTT